MLLELIFAIKFKVKMIYFKAKNLLNINLIVFSVNLFVQVLCLKSFKFQQKKNDFALSRSAKTSENPIESLVT